MDRLGELDMSPYHLAKTQKIVHEVTARTFLYSQRETSATVMCEMFRILDLVVVPADGLCKRCQEKHGVQRG
jgi:hypothetical protein